METVRQELPSGGWVECFEEMKHGTMRKISEIVRPHFISPKVSIPETGDPPTIQGNVNVDFAKIDFTAINDTMILNQVASWSFGDVNRQILDDLSEKTAIEIKNIMDGMYGNPLAGQIGRNLQNSSSDQSKCQEDSASP